MGQSLLDKFFKLSGIYVLGREGPPQSRDLRDPLRTALAYMFPDKNVLPLINWAIDFSLSLKNARGISYDPSLYSDPTTLICAYAEHNRSERHAKFAIEHLLAAIIAPFVRYDPQSRESQKQQQQIVSDYLAKITSPRDGLLDPDLAARVSALVKKISLVSEISLPWKTAMQETCSQQAPALFKDFAHMVGEAAEGDGMVLAIRGIQKLLLVLDAMAREEALLSSIKNSNDLPSNLRTLLNEIKSVYLPLIDAFGLKQLSSEFKEAVFRLEEPKKYREVFGDLLEIARRSVPAHLARQVKDWSSARGIIRKFYAEEITKTIPESLRAFVKIEARLKTPYSLFQKFEEKKRKGSVKPKDGPDILDIIAARILVFCEGSKDMSDWEECRLHDNNRDDNSPYDFPFTRQEQHNLGKVVAHLNGICGADGNLKQLPPSEVFRLLQESADPRIKYCQNLILANPDDTFTETYASGGQKFSTKDNSRRVCINGCGKKGVRQRKASGYFAHHDTLTYLLGKALGVFEIQVMTLTNYLTKNSHNDYQAQRTGIPRLSRNKVSKTVSVRILEEIDGKSGREKIVRLRKGATLADALVKHYGLQALHCDVRQSSRLFSHEKSSESPPLDDYVSLVSHKVMTGDAYSVSLSAKGIGYDQVNKHFHALIDACTSKERIHFLRTAARRFFGNLHRRLDRQGQQNAQLT